MRILFCHPYARNIPHFETDLEIIQRHLDEGDDVTMLFCNANLMSCDINLDHDVAECLLCMGRRLAGVRMLSKKIILKPLYLCTEQNKTEIGKAKIDFYDIAELRELRVDNFDIGYGVLSSLISATRNPIPDLKNNKHNIARMIVSSLALYRSVQNYLADGVFDRVYSYNGRYAPTRAVLRACQSRNIECMMHERGSRITRFALYRNTLPHDIAWISKSVRENWRSSQDIRERETIGSQFYLDNFNAVSHTWFAFTKNQNKDLLPQGWDEHKNNIAIFISSEDEFAAIGDIWKSPLYASQFEGLTKILEDTKSNEALHFYLRVHPNLRGVINKQTEQLASLEYPHLTNIPAGSPISTYKLLQSASKIISFGSTVGIEATFWGKPSILAGMSFYRDLGATYNPASHEELISLLYQDLPPRDKEGALMYGYYMNTFGFDFRYYEARAIYEGLFKGRMVSPSLLFKVMSRCARIFPISLLIKASSLSRIEHSISRKLRE